MEVHREAGVTVRLAGTAPDGVVAVRGRTWTRCRSRSAPRSPSPRRSRGRARLWPRPAHGDAARCSESPQGGAPAASHRARVPAEGEESDRGALAVLEHANLGFTGPANAFALHVHALADPGEILWRPGVFMAYGDWFSIDLAGPGGHASQPQLVGNPIDAAGEITSALKVAVAELSEPELVVATVTESRIGNTVNVIPASGRLRGTMRSLSLGSRSALVERMQRIVSDVARAYELSGEVTIHEGYPAVVNDDAFTDRLIRRLGQGEDRLALVRMAEPSMVIEDFAYFLQHWPGAMVYLGARGAGNTSFNHSDDVVYDEGVLPIGAATHLLVADGI